MKQSKYKKFEISQIQNKKVRNISSKQALSKITPIKWSKNVEMGTQKVIVSKIY